MRQASTVGLLVVACAMFILLTVSYFRAVAEIGFLGAIVASVSAGLGCYRFVSNS